MTAEIIPFNKPKQLARVCSFCKVPETVASSFFASNTSDHCICGECIKKATQRLVEGSQA